MHDTTTLPANTTHAYPWQDRDGQPVRPFTGRVWTLGDITVSEVGLQTLAGWTTNIVIDGLEDRELTRDELAWLAGVLQELAQPIALSA